MEYNLIPWVLMVVGSLAALVGNIQKIREAVPFLTRYPKSCVAMAMFIVGASAGVRWEWRIVSEKQAELTQMQRSAANLQQKYESLKEASSCKHDTPQIVLYEDATYKGRRLCFTVGAYPDLRDFAYSDVASSIRLVGDVRLVVYEDVGYGGRLLTIDQDYDSLQPEWNDKISSLKVCKKQDPCD